MGMSSGGNKGGVQSEINVTPLIDVLLVLLIIFLVVMPIMMKMETLDVPRNLENNEEPDPEAKMLAVKVLAAGDVMIDDNGKEIGPVPMAELRDNIEQKVNAMKTKVVFIDFEPTVKWGLVVGTMDQIRGMATDKFHDDITVALKLEKDKDKKAAGNTTEQ